MAEYEVCGYKVRDIQMSLIEILDEIDRLCKEYGIKYSLAFGTLLGAVRNKGFIPWDEDLDIMMTRVEFDKFIKACKVGLSKKYFLMDPYTEHEYPFNFAKIVKEDTVFLEEGFEYRNVHKGIYVDIFPLDEVYFRTYKIQSLFFSFFRRIRWNAIDRTLLHGREWRKSHTYRSTWFLGPLSIIGERRLLSILEFVMRMNNNRTKTDGLYPVCYANRRFIYKKEWFNEYLQIEFEGKKYPSISEWDKFLEQSYGDYMKLPPECERKPGHKIVEVKL